MTNGVSTNGGTGKFMFFDRGTFWVLPLTYFYLPKSTRVYPFSPICHISCYFCSGPISVDPICQQPKGALPGIVHAGTREDLAGPRLEARRVFVLRDGAEVMFNACFKGTLIRGVWKPTPISMSECSKEFTTRHRFFKYDRTLWSDARIVQ